MFEIKFKIPTQNTYDSQVASNFTVSVSIVRFVLKAHFFPDVRLNVVVVQFYFYVVVL